MATKGQKFRKYNKDLKMKVIMEQIEEGRATSFLSNKHDISMNTIDTWVYQYKHGNRFDKKRGRQIIEGDDYKERYEILKKYQTFLKEQQKKK